MYLDPSDLLVLGDGHALAVIITDGALSAVPARSEHGGWRRAVAGDGTAEALIRLLTRAPGRTAQGRFLITSWAGRRDTGGERAITVDQTNESVIVGDAAVVKWATHLEPGPHPAPDRLSTLTAAGFTAMPAPWGLVTWQPEGGAETLVASVSAYLPAASDGWTWGIELFAAATKAGDPRPATTACAEVGVAVADMHTALAATVTVSTAGDAGRWLDGARETLAVATALAGPDTAAVLDGYGAEIADTLAGIGDLVGVPILDAHGDLHVGQVLRSQDRFVITDFDGNPVLPPGQRALPAPAALDVAGMVQSLAHVEIVVPRYHDLDPVSLQRTGRAARAAFQDSYTARLAENGHLHLFTAHAVGAFRLQQVLREIVYAGRHLPRWMYVPDAALPALLKGDDLESR